MKNKRLSINTFPIIPESSQYKKTPAVKQGLFNVDPARIELASGI